MFFLVYNLVPAASHPDRERLGEAFLSCWIERDTVEEADQLARQAIEQEHWEILERESADTITRADYADDDEHLEYYEQALTNGEVFVFHTSPRYPVYWVTANVEQQAPAGAGEAHYFLCGDSIKEEGEDVFDPAFWTGERRHAALDAAREVIEETGWTVVAIVQERPCGRRDLPEELFFAYDEAEEEGSCLVFLVDDDPASAENAKRPRG